MNFCLSFYRKLRKNKKLFIHVCNSKVYKNPDKKTDKKNFYIKFK